jgi:hypothetical protein
MKSENRAEALWNRDQNSGPSRVGTKSRQGSLTSIIPDQERGIVSRRAQINPIDQFAQIILCTLAMTLLPLAAMAAAPDATRSDFTTIELKTCKILRQSPEGSAWRCRGLPGYPVYVAEGDERYFVSVGMRPEKRRAAIQTLKPFNTIFPATAPRATIEWRVPRTDQAAQPYATIIRYYTSSEGGKRQVLVVSKVSPSETCQVALIDADANPDAIERARFIADTTAKTFDCKTPPTVEGTPSKPPL